MPDITTSDSINNWSDTLTLDWPPTKARVSQVAREVLFQSTTQKARISQIVREVIVLNQVPLSETLADTLNNWLDDTSNAFIDYIVSIGDSTTLLDEATAAFAGYYLGVTDDLSNLSDSIELSNNVQVSDALSFSDSLAYNYAYYATNYTVSVSDDIGAKGPGNKQKYGWKDGIALVFDAADIIGLFVSVDDLESFLADDIEVSCVQWIGVQTVAIGDQMWDSMMYGLMDDMSINAIVPRTFADNMVLGDSAALSMPSLGVPADSLSISDVINLILNIGLSTNDDSNNFDDTGVSDFPDIQSRSSTDYMAFSDALLTPVISVPATYYLRRYLNDIRD